MNKNNCVSMSELRLNLAKIKRKVQLGKKIVAVTYYDETIGYLVPLDKIPVIKESRTKRISIIDFRSALTECWEELQYSIDCFYLTYHNRIVIGFVSSRLVT